MISMAGKLCIILDFASFAVRAWECRILFRFWERRARVWRSRSRQTAAQAARWDPWSELMLVRPRSSRTVEGGRANMSAKTSSLVVSLALLALPALAQPTPPQSPANPSTQSSGAGVAGLPGGKSGPAVRGPQGQKPSADQTGSAASQNDVSGVQGQTGKSERTDGKPALNRCPRR